MIKLGNELWEKKKKKAPKLSRAAVLFSEVKLHEKKKKHIHLLL